MEPGSLPGYERIRLLGTGSFATVHQVRAPGGELLVEKVLEVRAEGEDVVHLGKRTDTYLRALEAVRHPRVERLVEARWNGPILHLLFDFVPGRTLDRVLEAEGTREEADVLAWAEDFLDGLAAIHDAGLLHRDLKPANLLVTNEGRGLILDLGLVKDLADPFGPTATGVQPCTPFYAAPEVLMGDAADPGTDLYSLGLVLKEALLGRARPPGRGLEEFVRWKLASGDAPGPGATGLSRPVRELLEDLLQRTPAARPASARDALARVRRIRRPASVDVEVEDTPGRATAVLSGVPSPPSAPTRVRLRGPGAASTPRPDSPGRLPRWVLVAWAGVLGAAALAGLSTAPARPPPAAGAVRVPDPSPEPAADARPGAAEVRRAGRELLEVLRAGEVAERLRFMRTLIATDASLWERLLYALPSPEATSELLALATTGADLAQADLARALDLAGAGGAAGDAAALEFLRRFEESGPTLLAAHLLLGGDCREAPSVHRPAAWAVRAECLRTRNRVEHVRAGTSRARLDEELTAWRRALRPPIARDLRVLALERMAERAYRTGVDLDPGELGAVLRDLGGPGGAPALRRVGVYLLGVVARRGDGGSLPAAEPAALLREVAASDAGLPPELVEIRDRVAPEIRRLARGT